VDPVKNAGYGFTKQCGSTGLELEPVSQLFINCLAKGRECEFTMNIIADI